MHAVPRSQPASNEEKGVVTRRYSPEELEEGPGPLFAHARRSDPSTSKASAASISAATLTSLETRVLEACRAAGERGLTTIELAEQLHMDRVTVSPRIAPLVKKGMLRDSGLQRMGPSGRFSTAWRAA